MMKKQMNKQLKKDDIQNVELIAALLKLRTIEMDIKMPLIAEIKVKNALITNLKEKDLYITTQLKVLKAILRIPYMYSAMRRQQTNYTKKEDLVKLNEYRK